MCGYPYILCYDVEVASLVVNKRRLDCILAEPEEGCQRPLKCCCNDFVIKNIPKMVFMLPFTMQFQDLCQCVCFSVYKGEF